MAISPEFGAARENIVGLPPKMEIAPEHRLNADFACFEALTVLCELLFYAPSIKALFLATS